MIQAKITNRVADGKGVRVFFDILKDGEIYDGGQSILVEPEVSKDYIVSQIKSVISPFQKAVLAIPEKKDDLIGLIIE